MNDQAYGLRVNPFEGKSHDIVCRIVEFPGWRDNIQLADVWPPVRPPQPVDFDTNFELLELEVPDYPNNTARWPIMSRRMLDVLLSVREFPYHEVPVILVDDTAPVEVRYDALGRPRPEYSRTDFVAVQLAQYTDAIDMDKSKFDVWPMMPSRISLFERLVLSVPPEGLPPLFRMEAYAIQLFVSAEARDALERAGIRGPVYVPLRQI